MHITRHGTMQTRSDSTRSEKGWYRIGFIGALAAIGLVGVTAATASGAPSPASSSTTPVHLVAAALVPLHQPSSELRYVPVTPCRIVDTRTGGGVPIGNKETRAYTVTGTDGFSGQGGAAGGCGISESAVAVAATITAVSPTRSGSMRAWPVGKPQPTATALNYSAITTGTGVTLTIAPAAGQNLQVWNNGGPTDLVIDVSGYYVPPMVAVVGSDGSLFAATSRVLSVTRQGAEGTGRWEVKFDRAINYCSVSVTVTPGGPTSPAFFGTGSGVWDQAAHPDVVLVQTYDDEGIPSDKDFYIQVDC